MTSPTSSLLSNVSHSSAVPQHTQPAPQAPEQSIHQPQAPHRLPVQHGGNVPPGRSDALQHRLTELLHNPESTPPAKKLQGENKLQTKAMVQADSKAAIADVDDPDVIMPAPLDPSPDENVPIEVDGSSQQTDAAKTNLSVIRNNAVNNADVDDPDEITPAPLDSSPEEIVPLEVNGSPQKTDAAAASVSVSRSNAVINADPAKGGEIVTANLKKHVNLLISALKLGNNPSNEQQKLLKKLTNALNVVTKHADELEKKRTDLSKEMRELNSSQSSDDPIKLREKTKDLTARQRKHEGEFGAAIAKDFGAAAAIAQSLGVELNKTAKANDDQPLRKLSWNYRDMSFILRRAAEMHETAAARFDMGDYVDSHVQNLRKNAPGLDYAAGSIYSNTTGVSVNLDQVTHAFGLKYESSNFWLSDEDIDPNTWKPDGITFNVDVGISKLLGISVSLHAEGSRVFRAANTTAEIIANEAMDKANSQVKLNTVVPGGIKIQHALDYVGHKTKRLLGETLTTAAPFPYHLAERNIGKGADNRLMLLAANRVDKRAAFDAEVKDFAEQGYPSILDRLEQNAYKTVQLPDNHIEHRRYDTFNPMSSTAPPTYAIERQSLQRSNKGLSLGVAGKFLGAAKATGDLARLSYMMEFTSFAHETMDLGYRRFPGQLFAMDHYIEAANKRGGDGGNPRYHLYRSIDEAIVPQMFQKHYKPEEMQDGEPLPGAVGEWGKAVLNRELTQEEYKFFGPKSEIPPKFQNLLVGYTKYALLAVNEKFQKLEELTQALVDAQGILLFPETPSKEEASLKLRKDIDAERQAAFDTINKKIWGASPDTIGSGYPGGAAKALKNYESAVKFYAQSHDALSVALGHAGTYFSVMWHQIQSKDGEPGNTVCANKVTKELKQGSEYYQSCRELLEKGTHALRKETLTKYSTFVEKGSWVRETAASSAGISGGTTFNAIASLFRKSDEESFTVENSTGQIALEVVVRAHNNRIQVTPSRKAKHFDLTVNVRANGALGEAMHKLVEKFLQRRYPGIEPTQRNKLMNTLENSFRSLIQDQGSGATLSIRVRNNPAARIVDPHMQYMRLLKNSDVKTKVSKTTPTTFGSIKASFSRGESKQTVEMEIMGSDPAYNMLQFPKLSVPLELAEQLSRESITEQATTGLRTMKSQISTSSPQSSAQLDLASKGIRIVSPKVDRTGVPKESIETESTRRENLLKHFAASIRADKHLMNQFFGGTAIADIVGMFDHYRRDLRNYGPDALATRPDRNEFHRLYGKAPFKNPNETAHIGKIFGPGAIATGKSTASPDVVGKLTLERGFRYKTEYVDANGKAAKYKSWDQVMEQVNMHNTAEKRLDFYTKNDLGIEIFQAYIDIINTTREINKAGFPQLHGSDIGLVAKLRDQKDRKEANAALKLVKEKAKPSGDALKKLDSEKADQKQDSPKSSFDESELGHFQGFTEGNDPVVESDTPKTSNASKADSPRPSFEESVWWRPGSNNQDPMVGGSGTSNDKAQVDVDNSRDSVDRLDEPVKKNLAGIETDAPMETAAVLEAMLARLDGKERSQQQN